MTQSLKRSNRTTSTFASAICLANLILLMCFAWTPYVSLAGSGGQVGSGGDPRRIAFDQAQREAANWTNSAALNIAMFDSDTNLDRSSPTYKLLTFKDALKTLARDILDSDHYYRTGSATPQNEYTTCAWTNDPAASKLTDIVFSLDLCTVGLFNGGQSFANRLLIHESVHHLLLNKSLREAVGANFTGSREQQDRKEDQLCDDIAAAIQRAFERIVLAGSPHWRDIAIPFFEDTKAFDARGFHTTAWTGETGDDKTKNSMIIWGGCHEGEHTLYACGADMYFNTGAIYSPDSNTWRQMTTINAPSPRAEAKSAWTGLTAPKELTNKLIVWGGCTKGDGCEVILNDGGIYDSLTNTWSPISATSDSPGPRVHHSLVWTGAKIIVWGGHPPNDSPTTFAQPIQNGGVYDPLTKKWQEIPSSSPHSPSARAYHTAVWTGETGNPVSANKMLVWGGCIQEVSDNCSQPKGDGAFFDPETMTWSPLSAVGQAASPRHNYSALYVANQARLYIFGGFDSDGNVTSDGTYLDLKSMRWYPISAMSEGRFKHTAVWAGDKMLIFGGKTYNTATRYYEFSSSVLAYIPSAPGSEDPGRWTTYKTDQMIPLRAIEHSAVWTGYSMLVWGGQIFDRRFTNIGSQFFPGTSAP